MPALTDDERALLRAVIADPDADLPRLVYADFLDDRNRERDAERANLIRYQIAHSDQWTRANDALLPEMPAGGQAVVRRGFADWVSLSLAEFWAHAADLFARHPIAAVRLDDRFPVHLGTGYTPWPWSWYCGRPAERVIIGLDPAGFDPDADAHLIPTELADLADRTTAEIVSFETDDQAADWLSARCVQFGRRAAGVGG
jgi:uncharacterized protein (TIGR02996 family)